MSKGGTTSGSTEIPAWLESAAIENINKAKGVSDIGYVPYYGPDVAAFSPMQQQSMQSTGNAASAFGLAPQGFNAMSGLPQQQTFTGGVQGYSSAPLYNQALDELYDNAPAQYNALSSQFMDPFSGSSGPRTSYTPTVSNMGGGDNGRSPYGNDANIDHLNRMSANQNNAYDSIYRQNFSGDMTGGETFSGDDGNYYTVGYGDGQVDRGLANSIPPNSGNQLQSSVDAFGNIVQNYIGGGLIGSLYERATGDPMFNSRGVPVTDINTMDRTRPFIKSDGLGGMYVDDNLGGVQGINGVDDNLGGIQATPATMSGPMETLPSMQGAYVDDNLGGVQGFGGLLDYGQGQVDPGLQEARAMQDQINAQQQQAQQAAIQEAIVQQQIIEQQKQAERIKNDEIERERAIRLQIERERQIESNRQAAIAEANTRAALLAQEKAAAARAAAVQRSSGGGYGGGNGGGNNNSNQGYSGGGGSSSSSLGQGNAKSGFGFGL